MTVQETTKPPISKERSGSTRWQLLGLAFALTGLMPLAEWLSWVESGFQHIGGLLVWMGMFGLAGALVGLPVCFIGGCIPRFRRHAAWALVCLSIAIASFFLGFRLSLPIKRFALDQVVARAEPLVAAIHKFEATTGKPPQTLAELVPNYLATIPKPGIGTSPEFYYRLPERDESIEGNAWMLDVNPPVIGIGFDRFIYLPNQNYPERGWGGVLERIGTWAYVHE